jgi:hypothetical protein
MQEINQKIHSMVDRSWSRRIKNLKPAEADVAKQIESFSVTFKIVIVMNDHWTQK